MLNRILIATPKKQIPPLIHDLFNHHDFIIETIHSTKELILFLNKEPIDLICVDILFLKSLENDFDIFNNLPDNPEIIALYDSQNQPDVSFLTHQNIKYRLCYQDNVESAKDIIYQILNHRKELHRLIFNESYISSNQTLDKFPTLNESMQAVTKIAQKIAKSDISILITGETGVGKEHLAKMIHNSSLRHQGPFIAINCGALPEGLLESELFGHEKGAFTGASRSKRGWFELAHNGTIFLDEISELAIHLQVKLLRVLQEQTIQRVGSEKTIPINIRIMTASNQDLYQEVKNQRFRKDLFYRLNVIHLEIPPLKTRKEDIPNLIQSITYSLNKKLNMEVHSITREAMKYLCEYDWPGNIRELINILERAILLSNNNTITTNEIPPPIKPEYFEMLQLEQRSLEPKMKKGLMSHKPLKEIKQEAVSKIEKDYLGYLLEHTEGQISKTAKIAQISSRSLYSKMIKYGLDKKEFKT